MINRTIRDSSLILALALGTAFGVCPAFAQDAAWDGLINTGRAALQQDRFAEAERFFVDALETAESFPSGDPRLGRSLNNLAAVYYKQKDYDRAEPLMRRSLNVLEDSLGPTNADVAQTKKNLAAIYYLQGNFAEAEPLLQQSLATLEELHGPDHAFVATVLNNLAALYQAQDRYADAEPLLSRSLGIWEGLLGKDHPDVIKSRELLTTLRETNGISSDQPAVVQAASEELAPEQPALGDLSREQLAALADDRDLAVREGEGSSNAPALSANEPGAARQIVALAAEAEAAALADRDETLDAAAAPQGSAAGSAPVSLIQVPENDLDLAAKALAELTVSERSAAEARLANASPSRSLNPAGGPISVIPGQGRFAVYLSTLWSEDEARRYWQSLKEEIPDLLEGKGVEIEEVVLADGGGAFYRVLTAPFVSNPAAQEACNLIKTEVRTHDCSVVAR